MRVVPAAVGIGYRAHNLCFLSNPTSDGTERDHEGIP
jgi:hypothetical protein